MFNRFALLIALIAFVVSCSDRATQFVERNVTVSGTEYGYRVFVPKGRDPNAKLPVMLYLHGSGARGDDNTAQVEGIEAAMFKDPAKFNFIIVAPQCRANSFWAAKDMVDYALASLDASVEEFNGDTDRLYLSGFSLGGYGTWQIAAVHPKKFAALVPIAGGIVGRGAIEPRDRAAIVPEALTLLDSPDPYKAVAGAIGNTPAWVFHGAEDDSVPVAFSRMMVEALNDTGNKNIKYSEFADEGHQILQKAFAEPGLFEWLAVQRLQH